MRPETGRLAATLAAWRETGADRHDPLRFDLIAALAARAERHDGEARRLLETRLSTLVDGYARGLAANAEAAAENAPSPETDAAPARPLRLLLDALAQRAAQGRGDEAHALPRPATASTPAPAALADARALWTQVRAESQLRQSLAAVPEDAGPLNSVVLLRRALALMQAQSPGYLQHFLSYVDALAWLEQAHGDAAAPSRDAARADAPARRSRGARTRTRRA